MENYYKSDTSEQGLTVVCLPSQDDSLILCVEGDPDFDILLDKRSIDKISKIDDNIWLVSSGLAEDGHAVVRQARLFCVSHHLRFGASPSYRGEPTPGDTRDTTGGGKIVSHFIFIFVITCYCCYWNNNIINHNIRLLKT
jgi:hypothetical protein